jgi:hypothetical protein
MEMESHSRAAPGLRSSLTSLSLCRLPARRARVRKSGVKAASRRTFFTRNSIRSKALGQNCGTPTPPGLIFFFFAFCG